MDFNVPDELREEAKRLSLLYYEAFLNPSSKLPQSFMNDVLSFKEKVDLADKSDWDQGNEGKAPASIDEYYQENRAEAKVPDAKTGTIKKVTIVPQKVFSSIVQRIRKSIQRILGNSDSDVVVLSGKDWERALSDAIAGKEVNFFSWGGFEKIPFQETEEYAQLKASGKVVENFDLSSIAGKPVVVINPDNMITGAIITPSVS